MTAPLPPLQLPSEQASAQARDALTLLIQGNADQLRLQDLPVEVSGLVQAILSEVAQGHAVQIVAVHAELRTQEAADLLGVSRPHLVKLLDEGTIPHWKVGVHRRVRLQDVLDYRERRGKERQQALQQLADLDQELGLL